MKSKEKTKEQLMDELVKLSQQVTELQKSEVKHRQVEETLGENQEKYRILVELIDVGIQVETVEGRILECNTQTSLGAEHCTARTARGRGRTCRLRVVHRAWRRRGCRHRFAGGGIRQGARATGTNAHRWRSQIGRASCRERV